MSGKTAKDYEKKYTRPRLRERLKEQLRRSDKGGREGQWSARKSQLLAQEYEKRGGGYKGEKGRNQKDLERWTAEEWQTREGKARARHGRTTQRYLPKKAWEKLSPEERRRTDRKKQRASRRGRQYVANTPRARRARGEASRELEHQPKKDLYARARQLDIGGRSKMNKAELVRAIRRAG
jgi:Family of unknown function (DUF5872)